MSYTRDVARFELKGESLKAAEKIEAIVNQFYKKYRNSDDYTVFQARLHRHVITQAPDEARALGMFSPAIVVGKCAGYLRAYEAYPLVYHANDGKLYLDAPIDKSGNHFTPSEARRLSAKEFEKSMLHFYAGMGENISPVLCLSPKGIATPEEAPVHLSQGIDTGGRFLSFEPWPMGSKLHYHLPDNTALRAEENFQKKKVNYEQAVKKLTEAVNEIVKSLYPKIQARMENPESIRHSLSYFEKNGNGSAEIGLYLHSFGGQKIFMPDHPAFRLVDREPYTAVLPRTDTAAGKKLAKLFNAVPRRPKLEDEAGIPAGAEIKKIRNLLVLATDKAVPGLKAIPEDQKKWLDRDEGDISHSVKPPPRPKHFRL